MILETDRLVLREFRDEDADALAEFYADAEVMRWIGDGTPRPREETTRHIRYWQERQRECGYATGAARGICEWAFANLDVPRLLAVIRSENHTSIRVALNAGLRHWKDIELPGALGGQIFALDRPPGA